jgi:beta-mannosidase
MIERTSLNDSWRLLPVETFRHGQYPLPDDAWVEQELPAHWQQHPLFARYSGKMVYRKRFVCDRHPASGDHAIRLRRPSSRYWLRLNGIFYWSQPFLNGVALGRHEGYFAAQTHEVTAILARENDLVIEVECPNERRKLGKRMIAGVFSHWDCMDPALNPGGVWLPIELLATGPIRIQEVLLETAHASASFAELRFRATLNSAATAEVALRWTFAPKNFPSEVQTVEQRRSLAAGPQEIAGVLSIRDPRLWWTHDMGHPSCYTVTLDVLLQGGIVSDAHTFTFGIRRFELRNWIPHLNGVRFFAKGNNYPPTDARLATVTREECARDMRLAQACHMNMLRVHAHVAHPALYDAANEAGILLWQDMPLQWSYRREALPEAERQARQMVRLLYNHPSVVVWCMHNEAIDVADTRDERWRTGLRIYASVFGWSWSRDVMATRLKRAAEREDRTRPVVRSSGEFAVPLLAPGTDAHFYSGWYRIYPSRQGWLKTIRRFPKNIRFVTEFGAQSFPNLESSLRFMDGDIRRIDWARLEARHGFQGDIMARWLDWRGARSLEALIQMTQDYQIAINRFYIDRLRFHKYRPTGGILPFMFHDPHPAVLWSVLDYWRVPKRSYDALRDAFRPQYAFTLLDDERFAADRPIDLPIYVVNDAQRAVPVELCARLDGPNGAELAWLERRLTLPPDCMAIEAERLRLRPAVPGVYRLTLTLNDGCDAPLVNAYSIAVVAVGERTGPVDEVEHAG